MFEERDGGTELRLTHERIGTQPLRAFHIFGWKAVLEGLAEAL